MTRLSVVGIFRKCNRCGEAKPLDQFEVLAKLCRVCITSTSGGKGVYVRAAGISNARAIVLTDKALRELSAA